ncbi:MAG: DUF2384 domain-containing protein [Holophaga sp.]|nr:DUF2384 domain-containing protein [Holophaga sp.]
MERKPLGGPKPVFLEELGTAHLLGACRQLQEQWGLEAEVSANLLGTSRSTWFRWLDALKGGKEVQWTGDQRTRALALLRIYEAVADLHHEDEDARQWVHQPLEAPGFAGRTPLAVMTSGFEGLLLVRDYLDFLHSAWT